MIDAKKYTISVQFGNFDGNECFEARVREFPEIREYADTFDEAYNLAVDSVEIICQHNFEKGIACPAPFEFNDDFSGRVTLRLPISLHRKLSINADIENVSLNQLIVSQLYYALGAQDACNEVAKQAVKVANQIGNVFVSTYEHRNVSVYAYHSVDVVTEQAQSASEPSQLYPRKKAAAEKAYH
jgi:predicted HicB family RNase H-like nuclease